MATIIIAKNITSEDLTFDDNLGITISKLSSRDLTETFTKLQISESEALKSYVFDGKIVINNGVKDLSIQDGLKHINIETEYEDVDGTSFALSVTDGQSEFTVGINDKLTLKGPTVNYDPQNKSITVECCDSGGSSDLSILDHLLVSCNGDILTCGNGYALYS